MDDILKRLMAVEQEAEKITAEAEEQARTLMTEARRQANANEAAEQAQSAKDYTDVIRKGAEEAEAERQRRLAQAEAGFAERARAFTATIAAKRGLVTAALLG